MELWNPVAQTMPAEELKALQVKRLGDQIRRVFEQSPYYRDKFSKAGVSPSTFKTLEDIRHFPFFDKDEERISQARSKEEAGHCLGMHITCDPKKVVMISSTSGTTGTPTFTGYTNADRNVVHETGARCLFAAGVRPGDVVLHGFVLSMWIAGAPVLDMLTNYGCTVVPIGALSGVERFAQVAREVGPDVLFCTPSYAEYLIKNLPIRAGIEANSLGISKIFVAGEPGGSIPEVRQRISEGFGGADIIDFIGSTGGAFFTSVSCEAQDGMHYNASDYCLFEIVDPKTLEPVPFEHGAVGEIVYTGLFKECAPLVRWRDKDMVEVRTTPCTCGRPGFRFKIRGRSDDMMLVRGVNVYPHAVKDVVMGLRPRVTGELRIVRFSASPVVEPPMILRVEHADGMSAEAIAETASEIQARINQLLRFRAEVEMVPPGAFGGTHHKTNLFEKRYGEDQA